MSARSETLSRSLDQADLVPVHGRVIRSLGPVIEASGPPCFVGETCEIRLSRQGPPAFAEVIGFAEGRVLLMPWSAAFGVRPGAEVVSTGATLEVAVGEGLLGRVLDGLGSPIDGAGPLRASSRRPARGRALHPLERVPCRDVLVTGIRSIDSIVTCVRGQRLGIFAGGGVGKSVLLGMLARSGDAHVNVVTLVGERGREVVDFLERELEEEGRARSVIVVATADDPPLKRVQAARTACAIAEWFRDQGNHVLLLMDSLSRVAMAQREIGLSAGEPPTTRGYPPSSFAILPELTERAGATKEGSITGFYSILLEGDDVDAPISDAARAVLDGHLVLSRELATAGHFPAIDPLESVSRLRDESLDEEMLEAVREIVGLLAARRDVRDLISIGAYKTGSDPNVDRALKLEAAIAKFLRQGRREKSSWNETKARLFGLVRENSEGSREAA
jgi:FliI/YscN family ATPase